MKVFITTSGTGSRCGNLTKYTNKSMIKLGKKPAISYIIDSYPEDFEFVITLGYFGDHVKQYLNIAYPNRKFTFVNVDKYEGAGTSQVYSQLQAKEYLQEPFIYNDCDTIVKDLQRQVPMDFKHNFLVGFKSNSELYDSFDYSETTKSKDKIPSYKITNVYRKTEKENAMLSYIGIAGVYDYKKFWETFEKAYDEVDYRILNDTYVYIKYKPFDDLCTYIVDNWTDTGSISGIAKARETFEDKLNVLDKNDQAIFVIGDKVIKFFAKDGMAESILEHNDVLVKNGWAPEIIDRTKNFFSYKFIDGQTAIKNLDTVKFEHILSHFSKEGLWDDVVYAPDDFAICQYDFYIKRTNDRVNDFKEMYGITEDKDIVVNGVTIPKEFTVEKMLKMVSELPDFKNAHYTGWHGDFTLENIIYDEANGKYVLIDPRQNFVDKITYGDKIYDYAKMNHNLTFNFDSIYSKNYNVIEDGDNIHFDIMVNSESVRCQEVLKKFVEEEGISYDYINILTGMVWLSLCSLFTDPLTKFLYYLGKYTLYTNLIRYRNEK